VIEVKECYLCQISDFDILLNQKYENLHYVKLLNSQLEYLDRKWLRCKNCDLVHQSPSLTDQEIDKLYKNNRSSDFRNSETPDEYFERITSIPNDKSENYLRTQRFKKYISSSAKTILDIGCGGGVFLYTFSKYFKNFKLFGIEASPQFASMAKSKFDVKIFNNFFKGDEINFKPDVITLLHVLEHITNPNLFLKNIHSLMSSDSLLIIEVPDSKDFETLDKSHLRFSSPHIFFYSLKSATILLEKNGFKIIDSERFLSLRKRNNLCLYVKKGNND